MLRYTIIFIYMAYKLLPAADMWNSLSHSEFPLWYPLFSRHSIKSIVIPLPPRFVSYLESDGIVLPDTISQGAIGEDRLSDDDEEGAGGVWRPSRRQQGGHGDDAGASASASAPAPFDDLDAAIREAMEQLGGKVMVKLNDKAPVDALWMNGGSMMCDSLASIYLLLKASDKVASAIRTPTSPSASDNGGWGEATGEESNGISDASRGNVATANYNYNYLVLRKWAQLHPSMEFRCFVRRRALVGICQRDCSVHYSFLSSERHRIGDIISEFFNREVLGKLLCESAVIDVYVDKRDRVWIIGLSEFDGAQTDALLFSWEELGAPEGNDADFSSASSESATDAADVDGEVLRAVPFRVVSSARDALPRDASLGGSRGPSDLHLMDDIIFSRSSALLARNRNGDSSSGSSGSGSESDSDE